MTILILVEYNKHLKQLDDDQVTDFANTIEILKILKDVTKENSRSVFTKSDQAKSEYSYIATIPI